MHRLNFCALVYLHVHWYPPKRSEAKVAVESYRYSMQQSAEWTHPGKVWCHFCFSVSPFPCRPCKLARLMCWELPLPELKGYLKPSMGANPANSHYWLVQLRYCSCRDRILPSSPTPSPIPPWSQPQNLYRWYEPSKQCKCNFFIIIVNISGSICTAAYITLTFNCHIYFKNHRTRKASQLSSLLHFSYSTTASIDQNAISLK